jgi:hypothetical protein
MAMNDQARNNGQKFDIDSLPFFGISLPRVLFLALYQGAATFFFLIIATRKMRAERAQPFAKWEALLCMATVVGLTLGAFWQFQGTPFLVVGLLYGFVIAGVLLCGTITPNRGDYVKGIRRARRQGKRRAPILADAAANTWGVFGVAAWVAVGATIAWEAIEGVQAGGNIGGPALQLGRSAYSQTIAVGVFTVAYYGFGRQYFQLKFAKRGTAYFRLFLFLAWVLPMLIAFAVLVATRNDKAFQTIMSVSPWVGMVLSVNTGPNVVGADAQLVRFLALVPSVFFAFGFHFLLSNQQRKIDRELTDSPVKRPVEEPLAV